MSPVVPVRAPADSAAMPARISHYPRRDGKLPEGVRYVGRTSRWGNPYTVGSYGPLPATVHLPNGNRRHAARLTKLTTREATVAAYRIHAEIHLRKDPRWLHPLRAAPALACACPPDAACHVDVLLELLRERR